MPMLDIALFTIKHIKRLRLSHVSKKVKSDFFKILLVYSKARGNLVVFYIEPITVPLLYLIEDDEFNVDNLMIYHLSLPSDVPEQPSPLANLLEQGTPLTNSLSERTKKVWSRQLEKMKVQHSENIAKQPSLDEHGLHAESASAVSTPSKIAPLNLEMKFAAEKLEESNIRLDRPDSPFASNKDLYKTPPETHKAKVPMKYKKFCKQYSIADAWINGNIAKYHQKLSGRRSADFKFLYLYLECSTCAFPHTHVLIPVSEKAYTNVLSKTNVWVDGDFISAFASLVCHNNHSSVKRLLMKSGEDVPQLIYVTFPRSQMTVNAYKALPSSIKRVVAVMHTNLHYAVMEITIDTKNIKVFDGLHWPLLDWKDHVISAMRKCMLVDPHVVSSSAQFNADATDVELVGCSWKPKPSVNGYDIIIAMQKWQLEKGYFLHQSDGNSCGPIACMKIMELFHAIDVEEAQEVYKKRNICQFIMAEWNRLVLCCSKDLPMTVSEKPIDGSFEMCFCCEDSPSMDVTNLPCCKDSVHRDCVLKALQSNNQ